MTNWKLVGRSLHVFQTLKDRNGDVWHQGWKDTGYVAAPGETLEEAIQNYR